MKLNTILNRYILGEMFPPFLINMVFITFIFLMAAILKIMQMIVNYRVSIWKVFLFIIYTIPYRLEFIIPMSVMMSILLTFLRMSSDNEIVALKASGISLYGLLPPTLLFCFIGAVLTAFTGLYASPWGRESFKRLALDVARTHLDVGLKERTFNDTFKGVMLYVNKIDLKNNRLIDVFIEDQREEKIVSMVVAPSGRLIRDPDGTAYHLRLFNGTVNQVNLSDRSAHTVRFDTYDLRLDMQKLLAEAQTLHKDEREFYLPELVAYLKKTPKTAKRYYLALMEFHQKFSLPASCLALGLLAIPLGIQSRSSKRSYGIGLGLFFFLFYYLLFSAARVFGKSGLYPPLIGLWVPNIVMGAIGILMLVFTAQERSLPIEPLFDFIQRMLLRARKVIP